MEIDRVKQKQIETEVFTIYMGGLMIKVAWEYVIAKTENNLLKLCIIWISLLTTVQLEIKAAAAIWKIARMHC